MLLTRHSLQIKGHTDWMWKSGNSISWNGNQEKTEVAILLSDKMSIKSKTIIKDIDRHYIMIKELIQYDDVIFVNICSSNLEVPKPISKY